MTKAQRLQRIRTHKLMLSLDEIHRLDRIVSDSLNADLIDGEKVLFHMDNDVLLLAAIKGCLDS